MPDENKFCGNCGTSLDFVYRESSGSVPPEMMGAAPAAVTPAAEAPAVKPRRRGGFKRFLLRLLLLLLLLAGVYVGSVFGAGALGDRGNFETAAELNIFPQVSGKADPKLEPYLAAGCLLRKQDYAGAEAAFRALLPYRKSETFLHEAQYQQALARKAAGDKEGALALLAEPAAAGYADSVSLSGELKAGLVQELAERGESLDRIEAYLAELEAADYGYYEAVKAQTCSTLYDLALQSYEAGDAERAAAVFHVIEDYKDSAVYLARMQAEELAPTLISAEALPGESGIRLTWAPLDGASAYEVLRKGGGAADFTLCGVSESATYLDTSVRGGEIYIYTVRAELTVTDPLQAMGTERCLTGYDEAGLACAYTELPRNLTLTMEENMPVLRWDAVENAAAYVITRAAGEETVELRCAEPVYMDESAEGGVTYTYCVAAEYACEWEGKALRSPASESAECFFTEIPAGLRLTAESDGLLLQWEPVENAAGYLIYRKADDAETWEKLTAVTGGTQLKDRAAEQGHSYAYTVAADYGSAQSEYDPEGVGLTYEETTTLRLAFSQSAANPEAQALQTLSDRFFAATNGRYRIEISAGSQSGSQSENLTQVMEGSLDMAVVSNSVLAAEVTDFYLLGTPFVFDSEAHLQQALEAGALEELFLSAKSHGFRVTAAYCTGARNIYTTGAQIREPEDLQGLKIRVMASETCRSMLTALGAVPSSASLSGIAEKLSGGELDGAENTLANYMDLRHYEAAPVYNYTRHLIVPDELIVSSAALESMSEEDQNLLLRLCRESQADCAELVQTLQADYAAKAEALGVTFTESDTAALREACREEIEKNAAQSKLTQSTYEAIRAAAE